MMRAPRPSAAGFAVRRALPAATALGIAVLTMTAAAPASAAGSGSEFFSATTTTSALHVSFAQSPADSIITASLVDDAVGYAASTYGGDGSSDAQAAPFYPGKLVVQGPALLCSDVFTCPATPPAYPLLADASYPRQRSASISTSKQSVGVPKALAVTPATANATAGATGNHSQTSTGGVSLLPGTPIGVAFGASTAASTVTTSSQGEVVHVESALSGITIGGLIRIDSVRTVDDVTLRAGQRPVDQPKIIVSGVTVAGQPATIDGSGIHVAGQDGPALTKTLANSGLTVRSLGVTRSDTANSARSTAGGLQVDVSVPVTSAPYIPNPLASVPPFDQLPGVDLKGTYLASLQIGGAGIAGASQRQIGVGAGPLTPSHSGSGVAAPRGTSGSGTAGTPAIPGTPGTPGTPGQQAPLVAAAASHGGFLDALSREALESLYLVLALGSAAIFLGWRGSAMLRQHPLVPGRRP